MESRSKAYSRLNALINKYERTLVIIILVLAFVWRLIYFLEILHSPYGNILSMDSLIHHDWAVKISSGEWLHDEEIRNCAASISPAVKFNRIAVKSTNRQAKRNSFLFLKVSRMRYFLKTTCRESE